MVQKENLVFLGSCNRNFTELQMPVIIVFIMLLQEGYFIQMEIMTFQNSLRLLNIGLVATLYKTATSVYSVILNIVVRRIEGVLKSHTALPLGI